MIRINGKMLHESFAWQDADDPDETLDSCDKRLRRESLCQRCGLPRNGLVGAGDSLRVAGLCCCDLESPDQLKLL